MHFPATAAGPTTGLEIALDDSGFPRVVWTGLLEPGPAPEVSGVPVFINGPGLALLGEHSRALFTRPHLRGQRIGVDGDVLTAGRDWSSRMECTGISADERLVIDLEDTAAGLQVRVEFESLHGGVLRGRASVTNTAPGLFLVEGLELVLPVSDQFAEVLDFTGRHERERCPQRHEITDGLYLRESRGGRPGLGAATMLVAGTPGFSTTYGEVLAVHVAWSGNSVLRLERDPATGTTLGGGELLKPGEIGLAQGETYASPWVHFVAADDGLDGVAAAWHTWQRTLPTHPGPQPVLLNVWEAVFFDHDLDRLKGIAQRAARVGVERFVLDDGWFRHRRDDHAGLGDWYVDEGVWPDGLTPLVEEVQRLGMTFGLWFEPEMINPDSDLYREHPDWILSAGGREPVEERFQQALDLSRAEVRDYLFERIDAVLSAYDIEYVKWDHNRDLLEAGGAAVGRAPVAHAQTLGYYDLLDRLRAAHPDVHWESCASGGGRIDLGVLEKVQRFWTSDMTDALARQQIQRWTSQLLAPEYVGAHVSAPHNHATGRTFSLDFRCVTALFGSFGIEWDLTQADDDDLDVLAGWVERYKRFRGLLQSGRMVRPESPDPDVLLHGVVAADRSEALIAHVQLDEPASNRGVAVRVPGLDPTARYALAWEGPVMERAVSKSYPLPEQGPTGGVPVSGAQLGARGFWVPRRIPESVTLVHLVRQ